MVSSKCFVIFALALSMVNCQQLEMYMSGRDLPNRDPGDGAPDVYLDVYLANTGGSYEDIGKTDDISDNNNPDWPERFALTYNGGNTQKVKLDVSDADWPDSDDYMGYVEFTLGELYNAFGRRLDLTINGGTGRIIVTAVVV